MIRVLMVDDELQLVEAFKKQLAREGIEVVSASCAAQAISLVNRENFDVGVLDIKLPDLDGVELLSRLKQKEPALAIIMLTGFASLDTAVRSIELGACSYLTKPCRTSELLQAILRAYESRALKQSDTP